MSQPLPLPPSDRAAARRPPGVTLKDFQILKKLGSGTMGSVYLARQISRDRHVALKVLAPALVEKPSFVDRFEREAQVLAALDHPNIVRLYGMGVERGCYYYAMEYVHGFTLARLREGLGGRLEVGDALYVALECAAGLAHAHERDIVHRDVKPDNVMITHLGAVKITDLGLAKGAEQDPGLTDSGAGVGTPRYMAPEQARNGKHADRRSDVYALGGTLYHLLTGRLPFEAESAMELLLLKEEGYFPPARRFNPEVPPRLDLMLDKMLSRDPRLRYPGCEELISDLRSLNLANEHLGFNPLQAARELRPEGGVLATDRIEVLLVHDVPAEVRRVQGAVYQSGVPSNLRVVRDADRAIGLLRREGRYAGVPRPHLILLGLPPDGGDFRDVLREVRDSERLRVIPVVTLGAPRDADGVKANLDLTKRGDLARFGGLLRTAHALCVTVVETPDASALGP